MDRLTKGKYFSPIIWLLPYLLYIIMCGVGTSEQYSLSVVLAFCFGIELISRYLIKDVIFRKVVAVIAINFLVTLIAWLFLHRYLINKEVYYIILEIWLISSLIVVKKFKILLNSKNKPKDGLAKSIINDFDNLNIIIRSTCLIHIFCIVIYNYIESAGLIEHTARWNFILFIVLPSLFILVVSGVEVLKKIRLFKKLSQEIWLPIINDKGGVTGKIAESLVRNGEGLQHCYPIIRVALICKNKIFLKFRSSEDLICPGKLDHPFEKFVHFGHKVEEAAISKLRSMLGLNFDISRKEYVMKYKFEDGTKQRLIFLYSLKIDDESEIDNIQDFKGKFWHLKQIESAFEAGILSETFELEYEYIKNVVL